MLPIFVGFVVWVSVLALIALAIVLASPGLRPFCGFVFLTPVLGAASVFVGFLAVGWFFDKRGPSRVGREPGILFGVSSGWDCWRSCRSLIGVRGLESLAPPGGYESGMTLVCYNHDV